MTRLGLVAQPKNCKWWQSNALNPSSCQPRPSLICMALSPDWLFYSRRGQCKCFKVLNFGISQYCKHLCAILLRSSFNITPWSSFWNILGSFHTVYLPNKFVKHTLMITLWYNSVKKSIMLKMKSTNARFNSQLYQRSR